MQLRPSGVICRTKSDATMEGINDTTVTGRYQTSVSAGRSTIAGQIWSKMPTSGHSLEILQSRL
jgi:hypothetical protein